MSDTRNQDDGKADALAATAVITVIVATVVYWLSHMPA